MCNNPTVWRVVLSVSAVSDFDPVVIKELGFMTGMPITVTVERGRIVIETEINL
ncbi:SymE family type I addiction module toxin [Pectobacterium parmentieri]|uniref:SymE family type I addiction module toxin n=1 Tax=Pectobacterium parmentieri TaxID=1905730 RepID=UPI0035C6C4BD